MVWEFWMRDYIQVTIYLIPTINLWSSILVTILHMKEMKHRKLINLPKVIQPTRGRSRIPIQVSWAWNLGSYLLYITALPQGDCSQGSPGSQAWPPVLFMAKGFLGARLIFTRRHCLCFHDLRIYLYLAWIPDRLLSVSWKCLHFLQVYIRVLEPKKAVIWVPGLQYQIT